MDTRTTWTGYLYFSFFSGDILFWENDRKYFTYTYYGPESLFSLVIIIFRQKLPSDQTILRYLTKSDRKWRQIRAWRFFPKNSDQLTLATLLQIKELSKIWGEFKKYYFKKWLCPHSRSIYDFFLRMRGTIFSFNCVLH